MGPSGFRRGLSVGVGRLARQRGCWQRRLMGRGLAPFSLPDYAFGVMCRNIKTLFNFEPPATELEIHAAALQFVRKLSGFTAPSKTNEVVFNRAVADTAKVAQQLLESLVTTAAARDREVEAAKHKAQSLRRFGPKPGRASF